jgi:hypothetical protein
MNLTILGLGVALVVALPASVSAQKPEKPAVEDTAAKASPASTAPAESSAKGQVEPAAAPLREADEPPEDETGGAQGIKGQLEPAAAPLGESEPPDDETGGAQP